MELPDHNPDEVQRSFRDLSDEIAHDVEYGAILSRLGWSSTFGWDALLQSQRTLIISEAGTGKTHECRAKQASLWRDGEAAFYFDLSQLSDNNLYDLMQAEEEERFNAWRASQSDIATIFLDSIDELKLTLGSFETALKRVSKALAGHLGRVKIVITTRPIPVDRRLIQHLLPVPEKGRLIASDEAFADIAMNKQDHDPYNKDGTDAVPIWRNVALMPLSDGQIREMAAIQGVTDADALLEDIRKRNAEEFARRPQDLIELCADWRDHHRIRTHRDQVAKNIEVKLNPRSDRREKTQLTIDKALEGASRLALAALLTRKLTFRHSVEADKVGEPGTALDASAILTDWSADECETLLERALFGFATYGRVRFHHRSVVGFLSAQRLGNMLDRGMPIKAAKRLLFAETPQGIKVVKPSMRSVAAWLASSQPRIFSEIRDREPDVLLKFADPESLSLRQKNEALHAYVNRFGKGGWRGLQVPDLQVNRFASLALSPEVLELWESGIENPEVRRLLLEVIAATPLPECADIAYSVAIQDDAGDSERKDAIDALVKLGDPRLDALTLSMEIDSAIWSDGLKEFSIVRLFPSNIFVERLCGILSKIKQSRNTTSNLSWQWPRLISSASMSSEYLDELRNGLTDLVIKDTKWSKEQQSVVTSQQHLILPLAAACIRQLRTRNISEEVLNSSVIVIRLARDEHSRDELVLELREILEGLPASLREKTFWADDAFIQGFHPHEDPGHRLFEVTIHGAISLKAGQDANWILANLSDSSRPLSDRSFMLEAAIRYTCDRQATNHDHVMSLMKYVGDCSALTDRITDFLKPKSDSHELARFEKHEQKQRKQAERRRAKDHASWVIFWREVADNSQKAFSPDRAGNTAWNLWRAMRRSGDDSRASGWNRRFIEKHFSKDIADRLRLALIDIWRNDKPTLRSERPESEKGNFLVRWQLGLAAIAAEAEDSNWAHKLSSNEANLAVRYAPIEINGFPSWLESLAAVHPASVQTVLGLELADELDDIAISNFYCSTLQNIGHASPAIATLFLDQLYLWFDKNMDRLREDEDKGRATERLQRVIKILLQYDNKQAHDHICKVAAQHLTDGLNVDYAYVWLAVLMQLDPVTGTTRLEQCLSGVEPSPEGLGVDAIAHLFGNRHSDSSIDLRLPKFTPDLLLRLVRLAYRHVRPSDDVFHEGTYSPGARDNAEEGRSSLLSALMETKGPDGWMAKLELASDPLFASFRQRALFIAREKAAEESDGAMLSKDEVVALDRNWEVPPTTRDEMFALLVDRLDDLSDLLLSDDSPRAAWALIKDETVMRRELARELSNTANNSYSVDQESVTADEKETDIRLRSAFSGQQAVIELKIGEKNRSGRVLRNTIKDQLVTKYMASNECRSGCLLVTIANDKTWKHPDSGEKLDAKNLELMLQDEASRLVTEMSLELRLTARVLDLRPRLQAEKMPNSKKKSLDRNSAQ